MNRQTEISTELVLLLTAVACGGSQSEPASPNPVRLIGNASGISQAGMASYAGASWADGDDAWDCQKTDDGKAVNDEAKQKRRPHCCASTDGRTYPHIQEAFCRLGCDKAEVYCISAGGDPLENELAPATVPNGRVVVRVVSDRKSLVGHVARLQGSDPSQEARIHVPISGAAGSASIPNVAGLGTAGSAQAEAIKPLTCSGECEEYRLLSYEATATEGTTEIVVRFTVERTDGGNATVQRTYKFPIQGGKHYLEAGIAFPLTFNGNRSVGLAPLAGTGLQTLEVTDTMSWALALNVLVYPFGGVYATASEDRRWYWPISRIGFGLGTNVYSDRRSFTEGYLSLNYRIYTGATLGGGIAAMQGQFLKSQWSEGMVLPLGIDVSQTIETRYMYRWFFALTVSPDVFGGLVGLLNKVQTASSTAASE